jgi:prepilin peptidase CpaA
LFGDALPIEGAVMSHSSLALCATAITTIAVGTAMVTDMRSRRIPNLLTFPTIVTGLALRTVYQGWEGLALSFCGLLSAPLILLLLHGGRGLGMGDIKLAAAVGAILGPPLTLVAVFLTALVGGVIAIVSQLRPGGLLAQTLTTLFIGIPGLRRLARPAETSPTAVPMMTIPYGVGIAIGSLLTLVVYWCSQHESWFLWRVTHVVSL